MELKHTCIYCGEPADDSFECDACKDIDYEMAEEAFADWHNDGMSRGHKYHGYARLWR